MSIRRLTIPATIALIPLMLPAAPAPAPAPAPPELRRSEDTAANGAIDVPAITVPFSSFASDEAREAFIKSVSLMRGLRAGGGRDIAQARAQMVAYLAPVLARQLARFPARIEARHIAGVATDVVVPEVGVAPRNRHRVLIELHNGGFFLGGGIAGRVEAVPIAGLGGFQVIAVDYRQGPEYKYPAAGEDVVSVYRELLRHYPAGNIGIYGCSAGGLLTAEVVALLQRRDLPRPGAIGIFCASAGGWAGGDSTYFTAGFSLVSANPDSPHFAVSDAAYFSDADLRDPLVAPIVSDAVLIRFPPTLLISGSRDVAMSSAIFTHSELVKLGIDAQLHLWDGVGHAFLLDPDLPESREAYAVIVKFFDRQLGH